MLFNLKFTHQEVYSSKGVGHRDVRFGMESDNSFRLMRCRCKSLAFWWVGRINMAGGVQLQGIMGDVVSELLQIA